MNFLTLILVAKQKTKIMFSTPIKKLFVKNGLIKWLYVCKYLLDRFNLPLTSYVKLV